MINMKKLNFTKCPIEPHLGESWDKLINRRKSFTTMRGYSTEKHKYYTTSIGEQFRVFEEGTFIGVARLKDVVPKIIDPYSSEDIRLIQKDTFQNVTPMFFSELMYSFYGIDNPALLLLSFEWDMSSDITQY